jgi:hypothetical protein
MHEPLAQGTLQISKRDPRTCRAMCTRRDTRETAVGGLYEARERAGGARRSRVCMVLTRPAVGDLALGAFKVEEVAATELYTRGRSQLVHVANKAQIASRLHACHHTSETEQRRSNQISALQRCEWARALVPSLAQSFCRQGGQWASSTIPPHG